MHPVVGSIKTLSDAQTMLVDRRPTAGSVMRVFHGSPPEKACSQRASPIICSDAFEPKSFRRTNRVCTAQAQRLTPYHFVERPNCGTALQNALPRTSWCDSQSSRVSANSLFTNAWRPSQVKSESFRLWHHARQTISEIIWRMPIEKAVQPNRTPSRGRKLKPLIFKNSLAGS